jgi:hypothetical protein
MGFFSSGLFLLSLLRAFSGRNPWCLHALSLYFVTAKQYFLQAINIYIPTPASAQRRLFRPGAFRFLGEIREPALNDKLKGYMAGPGHFEGKTHGPKRCTDFYIKVFFM